MKTLVMITALIVSMIALSVDAQAGTVTANFTYTVQNTTAAVTQWVVELWPCGSTCTASSATVPTGSQSFTSAPATVTFSAVSPGTYFVKNTAKDASGGVQGTPLLSQGVTVPSPTGSIPTGSTVTAAP